MFPHYITCGPPQREEIFFREIKNSIFKFHYAIIKFLIFQKFCSFCSCVLRETSVVDYTERRKTEREKRKNVCFHHYIIIITGPPQREELLRKILGGVF
jgi:hypothetical protein